MSPEYIQYSMKGKQSLFRNKAEEKAQMSLHYISSTVKSNMKGSLVLWAVCQANIHFKHYNENMVMSPPIIYFNSGETESSV